MSIAEYPDPAAPNVHPVLEYPENSAALRSETQSTNCSVEPSGEEERRIRLEKVLLMMLKRRATFVTAVTISWRPKRAFDARLLLTRLQSARDCATNEARIAKRALPPLHSVIVMCCTSLSPSKSKFIPIPNASKVVPELAETFNWSIRSRDDALK
jgi:hypothetical protein